MAAGKSRWREVGFVGLGHMGYPMAANLLKKDKSIRIHTPAGWDLLDFAGAHPARRVVVHDKLADLASTVRVCFTMLPGPPEVEQVILGPGDCLLDGLQKGTLLIDSSTSAAELARRIDGVLSSNGCDAVDSPVSGSPVRAKDATLSLMVGGSPAAYRKALPWLKMLGAPTHMGPPGSGQITKSINQIIVGLVMAAIGEGIILGRASGIDLKAMLKAVGSGLAGTEVMRIKGPDMIREKFEPGAFLRYHLKDMNLALATADELGLSLPFSTLTREIMQMAVAMGRDEIDHSGLMTVIETMNGITVPKKYAGKTGK